MTTHMAITQRAIHILSSMESNTSLDIVSLLEEYKSSVQAGSFFPDWGYACAHQADASEAAHWPPFWSASISYIKKTYEGNSKNSERAKKLHAFLYGIVSHGVADAGWHSLDSSEGFVEVSRHADFNESYSRAHTNADFGGEMVLAHTSDLSFVSWFWSVPVRDLVEIYKLSGYNSISF